MKVKDIISIFYCKVEAYHKGQYIADVDELPEDHWLYDCDVFKIEPENDIILLDTR